MMVVQFTLMLPIIPKDEPQIIIRFVGPEGLFALMFPLCPPAPEDPTSECGGGGPLHGRSGGPSTVHFTSLQPHPGQPDHHPGLPPPGSCAVL